MEIPNLYILKLLPKLPANSLKLITYEFLKIKMNLGL